MVSLRRAVRLGVLGLIVLSALNISGKAGAAPADTPPSRSKLRVAWSAPTMTSGIPVWIAEEKRLFSKNGLDVELKHIASSSLGVSALLAGEIEVATGFGGPGAVMAALQGADLAIIASGAPNSSASILASASIARPEDLRGRRVAITRRASTSWFSIRTALRRWGMDPDREVVLLEAGGIGEIMTALKSGAADAGVLFEHQILMAKEQGYRELASLRGFASLMAADIVSKKFLAQHPDTVRAFLKTYLESLHFFHNNKAEAVKITQKYTRFQGGTKYLEDAYDLIVGSDGLLPRKPYPTEESIANILAELPADQKSKAKPVEFIDVRILRELDRSGFIDGLYSSQKDR